MKRDYDSPSEYWYYIQKSKKLEGSYKAFFYSALAVVILLVFLLLFSSCRSIQYIPVETVKTEYVTKTDTFLQKDSLVLHDSVYIHSKGDTVWYEKWHTKYKDRIVTKVVVDSFIKTDSIQVPYPVEKKLTKWQQFKVDWGGRAMVFCLMIFIMSIVMVIDLRQR